MNNDWIKEIKGIGREEDNLPNYLIDGVPLDDWLIKFISNLLKSRDQQLIEIIEGMKKEILIEKPKRGRPRKNLPSIKITKVNLFSEGYNKALEDILIKLRK